MKQKASRNQIRPNHNAAQNEPFVQQTAFQRAQNPNNSEPETQSSLLMSRAESDGNSFISPNVMLMAKQSRDESKNNSEGNGATPHTIQQGAASKSGNTISRVGSGNTVQRKNNESAKKLDFNDPTSLSNQELVEKLYQLERYNIQIIQGYYVKGEDSLVFSYNGALMRYNGLFNVGDDSVTVATAAEFLKRISDPGLDQFKKSLPSYFVEDVDTIINLLNNDAQVVERIRTDGEAYVKRLKDYSDLLEYNGKIVEFNAYFEIIKQRIGSRDLTQSDVDIMKETLASYKASNVIYDGTEDLVIKQFWKEVIDSYNSSIPGLEGYLAKSPKFLSQAEKKRTSKKSSSEENNPTLSAEGGSYISKGTKEGKEDKPNQSVLKFKGLYDKKNDTYSIYNEGKKGEGEVAMNDVVQGTLGDCYLLSSMASVAKANPNHIKSLISYKPGDSFATVTLYIMNQTNLKREPKDIVLDFYFPFTGLMESYAKKGDNELWVMLIEKAYAMEMGGYDNIVSGTPSEALAVLTGNKATEVTSDSDQLEEDFKNATSDGNVGVVGTKSAEDINAMNDENYKAKLKEGKTSTYSVVVGKGEEIICAHAYSVLSIDESDKKIHLRNPHGGDGAKIAISFSDYKACFGGLYYSKVPGAKK